MTSMSTNDNLVERRRLSLSPASPPYHLTKQEVTKPSVRHPQTPQSPTRMSTGHASPTNIPQSFSTSPQTTVNNSFAASSSIGGAEAGQIPGLTSQGTPMSMTMSRDGEREGQATAQVDTEMKDADDHRRTDHERNHKMDHMPLLCQTCKAAPNDSALTFIDRVTSV